MGWGKDRVTAGGVDGWQEQEMGGEVLYWWNG
jgi:hypothetical protein